MPLVSMGCSVPEPAPQSANAAEKMPISDRLKADLKSMESLRVFFAHQSVGANILDGLESLAKDARTNIRVASLDERPVGPGVVHALGGENGHPDSKIEFFVKGLMKLAAHPAQVALVKFCFVDFTPDTDTQALLSHYQTAVASLHRSYPNVVLVHVTAPLLTRPTGAKDRLYRLIGRRVWADDTNARRALFNDRLRSTFKNEPIFDLARIESTRPDGGQETFAGRDGQTAAALFSGYAADQGHLNALGQRVAAAEFVHAVVSAAKTRIPSP